MNLRPTQPSAPTKTPTVQHEARKFAGEREHVDIVIPRTTVRGKLRLCSRAEEFAVKSETRSFMTENGFPIDADGAGGFAVAQEWALELATRMVQRAVRDPENLELELAPVDTWRELDDQQILTVWSQYQDLVVRIDPLGARSLTDDQQRKLIAAAKAGDPDLLMVTGARALALLLVAVAHHLPSDDAPIASAPTAGDAP